MIDVPTGRVAYAVLSFGGVLGMGNKLFALPWGTLQTDEDEKCFILNVDKKALENAPGFDKDNWPDMADTTWAGGVYAGEANESTGAQDGIAVHALTILSCGAVCMINRPRRQLTW